MGAEPLPIDGSQTASCQTPWCQITASSEGFRQADPSVIRPSVRLWTAQIMDALSAASV